jgi:hypothetical protein
MMPNSVIQPTTLHEAWEQGLQQGVTQNMVRDGLDLAQVAKLTGLPVERDTVILDE